METGQYITSKDARAAHLSAGLGGEAFVYHTVGSTNEVARELMAQGRPEGTVVLARAQTRGRGRMKRGWHSPEGGLYMSIILGPFAARFPLPLIPVMAGVALARALEHYFGLAPRLKWPNDVLLGEKKISGILSESAAFLDARPGAVLGIGVNVSQRELPREIADTATSLYMETGREPRAFDLLSGLLTFLKNGLALLHLGETRGLLDVWRGLSSTLGRQVRVELKGGEFIVGRAVAIDENGCLVVEAKGERVPVVAGDVVHLRSGSKG